MTLGTWEVAGGYIQTIADITIFYHFPKVRGHLCLGRNGARKNMRKKERIC